MKCIRQLLLNTAKLRSLCSDLSLLLSHLRFSKRVSVLGLPHPLLAIRGWNEELRDFVVTATDDFFVVQDRDGLEWKLIPIHDERSVKLFEIVDHQLTILP